MANVSDFERLLDENIATLRSLLSMCEKRLTIKRVVKEAEERDKALVLQNQTIAGSRLGTLKLKLPTQFTGKATPTAVKATQPVTPLPVVSPPANPSTKSKKNNGNPPGNKSRKQQLKELVNQLASRQPIPQTTFENAEPALKVKSRPPQVALPAPLGPTQVAPLSPTKSEPSSAHPTFALPETNELDWEEQYENEKEKSSIPKPPPIGELPDHVSPNLYTKYATPSSEEKKELELLRAEEKQIYDRHVKENKKYLAELESKRNEHVDIDFPSGQSRPFKKPVSAKPPAPNPAAPKPPAPKKPASEPPPLLEDYPKDEIERLRTQNAQLIKNTTLKYEPLKLGFVDKPEILVESEKQAAKLNALHSDAEKVISDLTSLPLKTITDTVKSVDYESSKISEIWVRNIVARTIKSAKPPKQSNTSPKPPWKGHSASDIKSAKPPKDPLPNINELNYKQKITAETKRKPADEMHLLEQERRTP